ncbi:Protein phosphatase [Pleurostoma richardsiae]|uniref:Protein phosphatase n=1 Tax=Pleurostoma richardsiae TaxID=41990 RepID=A0AA38RG56_9PEZI|nr:Protein phosphatase [Pleurostoma richardsiae]
MEKPGVKQTIENVHAISGGVATPGTLKLTDYHIIFSAPPLPRNSHEHGNASSPSAPPRPRESWITYPMIAYGAYRPTLATSGIPPVIRLRGRDFVFVAFNFVDEKSAREAFEFIRARTCRLGSIEKLYAFTYAPPRQERTINGWEFYDAKAEFRRQGISEKSADRGWRISSINKDYSFSPTYPALLAVPSNISDNTIRYAGNYRTRCRIPTLTYLHPVNNCSITRSSQPMTGLRNNRSIQDERLVAACFSATGDVASPTSTDSSPPTSQVDLPDPNIDVDLSETERLEDEFIAGSNAMYDEKTGKRLIYGAQRHNLIVDARPAVNSYAMQVVGKGSENMDNYKFAKKAFLNIDNIHVMRNSLNKVIEAIKDADVSPFPPNHELLEKSGWLKHIKGILDGSAIIARQVGIQHSHVLIHCSDGWDRTSQLSALSQLMLEPYYRTIDGFAVLVEKDWLSFGHMFQQRSGFLGHEKWFTIQNDALAGGRIEPNDNDGRAGGDAIENAMANAKRFFRQGLSSDKDREDSDLENLASAEESSRTAPLSEGQATRPNEISPVFHQFLDATYQLLRQHPNRFEFNERFLRRLLYHVYSCQYGTFLYNNEKQRKDARASERTASVWGYFLSRKAEFTNPAYDPAIDDHVKGQERLIFPKLHDIRWWHQLFNRTDDEMNGPLKAAASAAERIAQFSTGGASPFPTGSAAPSQTGTPQPPSSPQPPGLGSDHSVLAQVESAHSALTPEQVNHASAGEHSGRLASLRDGIAVLGINKSVLSGLGRGNATASGVTAGGSGEEEMKEMF